MDSSTVPEAQQLPRRLLHGPPSEQIELWDFSVPGQHLHCLNCLLQALLTLHTTTTVQTDEAETP